MKNQTEFAPDKTFVSRQEFIEVTPNVRLHITDLGEGKPLVLIHGWPLSDAMYEYQYQYFVERRIRVIGITLRGFGISDKPYGKYDYEVFATDIKTVLEKLEIQDAVLGGFSMGGAVAFIMLPVLKPPISANWRCSERRHRSGRSGRIILSA